jgi:hypothetical protein
MKVFGILFLAIFLTSCFAKNNPTIALYEADLRVGDSAVEILQKFGSAQKNWKINDEYDAFSYSHSRPIYNFSSFIPLPLFDSEFVNYEVVLVFDKNEKLVEAKKFSNRVKIKSWFLCEDDVADCLIEER